MHADPDELGPDAESFVRVIDLGSSLDASDFERIEPPEGLWDSIAARLGEADRSADAEITRVPTIEAAASVTADDPQDRVVSLDEHRRSRRTLVTAAAAAVLLVVGAVGIGVASRETSGTEVVASTTLDVLEGPATASAKLIRTGDDERLVVTARDMPPAPPGTHYELWLVDPAVTDPRSLGAMTGTTEVTVPASIDTDEFPVVDISLQDDGAIAHSGHSLLRGTLQ